MMKKNLVSYYDFRRYFFPLGEVDGSFSKLLTRANNYRKFLSDFFQQINHWALSIGMQKYAENCSFYVLKVQKFDMKLSLLGLNNLSDMKSEHLLLNQNPFD